MYRLIILSAIIVASFGKAPSCNETYNVFGSNVNGCQYNNTATCNDKCSNAANSTLNHISVIWNNEAFEFDRSAVSFNDKSANDMLYSYILFFNCYRIYVFKRKISIKS